jgi:ribosome-associated translation inhibitor RaiA
MRGKYIFIYARHDDIFAAIDNLTHKLDRHIIKHKEMAAGSRAASTSLKHSAIDQEPAQ